MKGSKRQSPKCLGISKANAGRDRPSVSPHQQKPYEQAAPVLLNCRSSPRPDGARLLGKLRRRDRAAESLNTPMHLAESARQEEKLDERPVGHRWTRLWPAGLVLATFCMC